MFTLKLNGWSTPKNLMSGGIRQGCRPSSLLFNKIRINKNIERFLFGDVEIKLSQYSYNPILM